MNHQTQRQQAEQLCAESGITIHPYGQAWWLLGDGINRVVADLAGLTRSDLRPLKTIHR
ncbi:hypothetical protein [Dechloromonas sp.]|jgi:hypothetical protein|uniref:hypothetical protein n=1 Tax=Dechloromonas sp. TaxID=1917218 RepID=UPI00263F7EC0|nr:hypothetical protein [Dechloromonas sp.]